MSEQMADEITELIQANSSDDLSRLEGLQSQLTQLMMFTSELESEVEELKNQTSQLQMQETQEQQLCDFMKERTQSEEIKLLYDFNKEES